MSQIIVICVGIILLVLLIFVFKKQKQLQQVINHRNDTKDIQTVFNKYGEPDEIIALDATRVGEVESVVVIYKGKGLWVVKGRPIYRSAILGVTFNNASTPFAGSDDYQLVLRTTLDDAPYIRLHVGNERNWAREVFEKIQASFINDNK